MASGDFGDVLSPLLPIATIADALNHAGVKIILPLTKIKVDLDWLIIAADNPRDFYTLAGFGKLNFLDSNINALVMGAQGVENFPDNVVILAFFQNGFGVFIKRNDDGNNYVAVFFIISLAHDAPDGLNDFDFRFFGGGKNDGVKARHVHAFR